MLGEADAVVPVLIAPPGKAGLERQHPEFGGQLRGQLRDAARDQRGGHRRCHAHALEGVAFLEFRIGRDRRLDPRSQIPVRRPHRPGRALQPRGHRLQRGGGLRGGGDALGASEAEAVIHLAFGNDYATPEAVARSVDEESRALAVLGEALVGTDRPIVTVSGTPWIPGRTSTEHDPLPTDGPVGGRARSVNALLALADRGVRSAAVRLPRTVHDQGTGGFAGLLTERARETGVVAYPGDGTQRWPAVHARDAAVLFRLVLESAPAGTAWHAVADEGDAVRDIAAVIGRRLELPLRELPADAFGPFGAIFALDQPSESRHTRETLGWQPTHPSLLHDLENVSA